MRSLHLKASGLTADIYAGEFIILRSSHDRDMVVLARKINELKLPGVVEIIGSTSEVCLKIAPSFDDVQLSRIGFVSSQTIVDPQTYRLPVCLEIGGEWENIKAATGLNKEAIRNLLAKSILRFDMHGFLPGFMYLSGLPSQLHIPRKRTPEQSVPAGAVGLGGSYLGTYALPSPGGWYVIGLCPLKLFDKNQPNITRLKVGDEIKLRFLTAEDYHSLHNKSLTIKSYNGQL